MPRNDLTVASYLCHSCADFRMGGSMPNAICPAGSTSGNEEKPRIPAWDTSRQAGKDLNACASQLGKPDVTNLTPAAGTAGSVQEDDQSCRCKHRHPLAPHACSHGQSSCLGRFWKSAKARHMESYAQKICSQYGIPPDCSLSVLHRHSCLDCLALPCAAWLGPSLQVPARGAVSGQQCPIFAKSPTC